MASGWHRDGIGSDGNERRESSSSTDDLSRVRRYPRNANPKTIARPNAYTHIGKLSTFQNERSKGFQIGNVESSSGSVSEGDGLGEGLGEGVGDGLGEGLGEGVGDGLGDGLGEGVGDGLGDGLGEGLGDGFGDDSAMENATLS